MKRCLYIGINSLGTTSAMRAEKLREILSDWEVSIIDTDIPKRTMSRIWQSVGFRYKRGPLIARVNKYIKDNLNGYYDLIWVDKAIYITIETTMILRKKAKKMVHFTPDPAFFFHKSHNFRSSASSYDYLITTKSFELNNYCAASGSKDKVIFTTQGFDKNIHRPIVEFSKKYGVCFIGHYEKDREEIIKRFLDNGIVVKLAGIHWEKFVKNNPSRNLIYLGQGVYGEDYVKTISSSYFSLGFLSKWIPEKHTTRTFEIPACKTALITEYNDEIASFYDDKEVIYYNNLDEMVDKVKFYLNHKSELEQLIENGYNKVISGGYDYESIIRYILAKTNEKNSNN